MSKNYVIYSDLYIVSGNIFVDFYITVLFAQKKRKIFCAKIYQSIFNTLPTYKERQTPLNARVYCSYNTTTNNYTNTYTIG